MLLLLLLGGLSVVAGGADLGHEWVIALVLISGLGLFAVAALEPEAIRDAFSLPVAVLALMALLGVASLAWTEAPFDEALATALIPAAYGAVALTVAVLVGRGGPKALVGGWIVLMATIGSLTGLIGVLFHSTPWAAQIGGHWRTAGFVEYPPALAFLIVAALPPLLSAMATGRRRLRAFAIPATLICGTALLLTGNRLGIGCAVVVLVASLLVRAPGRGRSALPARRVAAFVVAGLIGVVVLAGLTERSSSVNQGDSGADHGRISLWADSMPAIGASPLIGHGSGSYFPATASDQDDPTLFAHNLIVESSVELGLGGGILALLLFVAVGTAVYGRRSRPEVWLFGPGVIAFLCFGLVDWQWHLVGVGAVWAVILGALLANKSAD